MTRQNSTAWANVAARPWGGRRLRPSRSLWTLAATLAFALIAPADARELDLSVPEDGVLASHRIACGSQREGHHEYGVWRGKIFGRVAWEPDRHLFDVVGVNARRCPTVVDPERGTGYRQVSREFMLFLEPGTENVLDTWVNPYTGKTVKVLHVKNDPVNLAPVLPYGRNGEPYVFPGEVIGDYVARNVQPILYFPNPLGRGFDGAVGGHVQIMEIYTHFVPKTELLTDSDEPLQNLNFAWHRVSDWMPWMEMGDIPGAVIYSTYGRRVKTIEELPQILQDALDTEEFAIFREPPPADDPPRMADEYLQYEQAGEQD